MSAALSAAQADFADQVAALARTPRGFAAGFARARARLLAPVDAAEHRGAADVRIARKAAELQLLQTLGEPSLLRVLLADPARDLRWRQLRTDFEDAGARLDSAARRAIAAQEAGLHAAAQAFAEHAAAGLDPADVRARLRTETSAQARQDLWASFHAHAAASAGICLDLLRLRRERANTVGFPTYAAWVDRDAAFAGTRSAWLEAMTHAARVRARTQPKAEHPWDAHRRPEASDPIEFSRDAVAQRLQQMLSRVGIAVAFDLAPRPDKRSGAWSGQGTIYASLPPRIGLEGLRQLLHELGHAAEAALSPEGTRVPTDAVELSSTLLEPWAWHAPTLAWLGEADVQPDRTQRFGWPALRQLALAHADRVLHDAFDPAADGSPLPWARRAYAEIEGVARDVRDATVATHPHLFARPHGYAARYLAYPIGDALAEHHCAQAQGDLHATLRALADTLWTERGRSDPSGGDRRAQRVGAEPRRVRPCRPCVMRPSRRICCAISKTCRVPDAPSPNRDS